LYDNDIPVARISAGNSELIKAGKGPKANAMMTPRTETTRTSVRIHGLATINLNSGQAKAIAPTGPQGIPPPGPDSVAKRPTIGKPGETGLAAGDHLHFGIYLAGVAVLPVEWWDPKWINDNITPKLEGRSGQEIAEAQQPVKAKRKGSTKKRR